MRILKLTENKDGSATLDYELTELELKVIKRALRVKRLTRKRINDFIMKAIIERTGIEAKKLLEKKEEK